jgi:hypothetical protein
MYFNIRLRQGYGGLSLYYFFAYRQNQDERQKNRFRGYVRHNLNWPFT